MHRIFISPCILIIYGLIDFQYENNSDKQIKKIMKTYEDLYKDYIEFQKNNRDISEEEYAEIMTATVQLQDIINEIVKYGRFAKYSKEWLEKNKEEILKNEE